MALDRIFGQLIDIARSFSSEATPPARPSAPPPPPLPARPDTPAAAASSVATEEPDELLVDSSPTLVDEPIVTVQMARLLVAQGHARRALAMFEVLAARRPDDAAIARELDTVRSAASTVARAAPSDDEGLAGEDEIVAIRASESDVLLSWQVGDARIARGKRLLPAADRMAVRIVLFHRGEGAAIRREERERIVERAGEWLVADVPRDAWMTASVGLRHDERFVSLTHSAATRAP